MPDCDMGGGCAGPVTHIGEKGYVYCAEHAIMRRGYERTRKLRPWEQRAVSRGQRLLSYAAPSYAEHVAHYGTLGIALEPVTGGIAL